MQPGALRSAFAFHQRIFDAIAIHDPDAAERAMQEHLGAVERYYWRTTNEAGAAVAAPTRPGR